MCARLLALLQAASAEAFPNSASLTMITTANDWVSSLGAAVQTSSSFRQKVLLALSAKEVYEPLHQFSSSQLSVPNIGVGHNGLEVCPRVHAEARRRLHEHTCDLLLKTALNASADGTRLDSSIGLALLEKRNTISSTMSPCEYYGLTVTTVKMASTSLFEAASTPQTLTSSHEWRTRLVKELTRDAKHQYESIVKMMGDICQDLEHRCDEAERPLRAEETKNGELKMKLETSQVRLAELEFQVMERTQVSEGLEVESNLLRGQVHAFEQRVQHLCNSLAELEQESHEAKKGADTAAEAAREMAKQQELTHLASMTGKDELLEKQGLRVVDLETRARGLDYELSNLRSQEVHNKENIERLEKMVNESNEVIEQFKATTASMEADVDRLIILEEKIRSENERLKMEVCGHCILLVLIMVFTHYRHSKYLTSATPQSLVSKLSSSSLERRYQIYRKSMTRILPPKLPR